MIIGSQLGAKKDIRYVLYELWLVLARSRDVWTVLEGGGQGDGDELEVETWLGERKEWLRIPVPLRAVIGELLMVLNFITMRLLTEILCYADHSSDIIQAVW